MENFDYLLTQVTNLIYGEHQDLLKLLSKILNFRIRQFRRFDGAWGAIDQETGQWNGMISNQIKGEVDIGTAGLTQCCNRTDVVDYLWPTAVTRESFAIKGGKILGCTHYI